MTLKQFSKDLTEIENKGPKALEILKKAYAAISSKAHNTPIIGITGLPGAGKSTLVDQLIQYLRKQNQTVGVIAVDPSSPFTGGALLGDRVRMQRHYKDDGVFIRSLGTRGAHGGLSETTRDLILCFDAFGWDQLFIETVGVGQNEVDILNVATTTVVVLTPESGDTVQTLKAGLTEIADIFVVNKGDREGADAMQKMLEGMLSIGEKRSTWETPVLVTQADKGKGIEALLQKIDAHTSWSKSQQTDERKTQIREKCFIDRCCALLQDQLRAQFQTDPQLQQLLQEVRDQHLNPYEALQKVVSKFCKDS